MRRGPKHNDLFPNITPHCGDSDAMHFLHDDRVYSSREVYTVSTHLPLLPQDLKPRSLVFIPFPLRFDLEGPTLLFPLRTAIAELRGYADGADANKDYCEHQNDDADQFGGELTPDKFAVVAAENWR